MVKLKNSYFEDKATISRLENCKIKIDQILDSVTLLVSANINDLMDAGTKRRPITKQLLCQLDWVGLIKPEDKLSDSIMKLIRDEKEESRINVTLLIPRKSTKEQIASFGDTLSKLA